MPIKIRKMALFISLIVLMAIMVTSFVVAQSGGGFDLTWSTIDGGGGSSSGNGFALSGTIGQPDVGKLSSGSFTVNGGFWQDATGQNSSFYTVYLPMVAR